MKKIKHPADTRGTADFGWLQARYSFSFANFFNPERIQFGALRVLNDDSIGSGMGFGSHPHNNMEIVTIPLEGSLKHKDSLGNEGVITSGEIQVMSAGSGVEHSEKNASMTAPINLLQLWVLPETKNVTPRYDQKEIATLLVNNTFSTVIGPKDDVKPNVLWIHQQAYFSLGYFSEKTTSTYLLHKKNHGVYIFVINGTVSIENETLNKRDALGIWDVDAITIVAEANTKALIVEVPMVVD